jgi:F0F1-type ATP synthase assembly protein I
MLDPHNIPYEAIERDTADRYNTGDKTRSSRKGKYKFRATDLLYIVAGVLLGKLIGFVFWNFIYI